MVSISCFYILISFFVWELITYGIDWNGQLPCEEYDGVSASDDSTVNLPSTANPLRELKYKTAQNEKNDYLNIDLILVDT